MAEEHPPPVEQRPPEPEGESEVCESTPKKRRQKRTTTVDSGVVNTPEDEELDAECSQILGPGSSGSKLELPSPEFCAQSSADSGKNSSGISRGSASPDWMPELIPADESDAAEQRESNESTRSSAERRARRRRHESEDDEDGDSDDFMLGVGPRAQLESDEEPTSFDCDVTHLTAEKLAARPKHKWNGPMSILNREYGYRVGRGPEWFRYDAMGSLHMVERLELMYKMHNHAGCVNCLHFNASGSRLASGSDDTKVNIWDWTIDHPILTFDTKHEMNVFQAKFMPLSGDCHIVTCARDGQVRLAELSALGKCNATRKLARHSAPAHKLALETFSPHVFLSCGEDAVVFELDLRDPKPNKLMTCKKEGKKIALYSIHSDPSNSNYFTVSGRDSACRIFDKRQIAESTPVKSFCPEELANADHNPNVTCAVYNYNGTELLATYNDDDIYVFDTRHSDGANYVHRYTGHRNNATVKGVNWFGPKSEFIVSGSDCGHVYFWERESEKIVQYLLGDEGGVVNCLEPHPTCPVLATSGLDHDVKVWVPSCEQPKFDSAELEKLTKNNMRLRTRDRRNPDPDADFIYYMLRQIRRRRLRRDLGVEVNGSDSSNDDEENEDSSDTDADEDGDGTGRRTVQCRPS